MRSNKLIIDENPLQVLPSLAKAIGLNEAIIVQQMHYWIRQSEKLELGRVWTYNSYESWRNQFPFWSERTIQRTILGLEQKGILLSKKMKSVKWDHTKWYTINYDKMNEIVAIEDANLAPSTSRQSDTTDSANVAPSLKTETSSETITERLESESKDSSSLLPPQEEKKDKEKTLTSDAERAITLWNDLSLPGISKVSKLTAKRRAGVLKRLSEGMGMGLVMIKIRSSDFLNGNNGRGWKIDFDWLIANDTNWVKVMEGKYDNKTDQDGQFQEMKRRQMEIYK